MNVETRLRDLLAAFWSPRRDALPALLSEARGRLAALLPAAEMDLRERSDADWLRRRSGAFGAEALDLEALAATLRRTAAPGGEQQLARLRAVHEGLRQAEARLAAAPPRPTLHRFDGCIDTVHEAFESHLASCSGALGLARRALLEVSGEYRPEREDAFFDAFDWRQLNDAEWACCPPFLVLMAEQGDATGRMAALLRLASGGKPLKIVLLHGAWRPQLAAGRAAALLELHDPGLLFLSLRRLFVVQSSLAIETLGQRLQQALASPRPALVSLFAVRPEAPDFEARCERARACRAFPHYVYDPDRGDDFAACLDLTDNPQPGQPDIEETLSALDDDGRPLSSARSLTFADYARYEPEFDPHFAPLAATGDAKLLPLARFLDQPPGQRRGQRPYVEALDAERRIQRLQLSAALVAYSDDRRQLWRMLRQLSGVDDARQRATERAIEQRLRAEHKAALVAQQAELEARFASERERLVEQAVRDLARRLTGIG